MANTSVLKFGLATVNPNYVFFNRGAVFAMLVHNPIIRGHVLVIPKNPVPRYSDLSVKDVFEVSLAV